MSTNRQRIAVVGGGTAGCMVVSHLANNTNHEIVLFEPGMMSPHDDQSRFFDVLSDHSLLRDIDGQVQARVLGGGSAINGMLLTGDVPEFARGLVRRANESDIGPMGEFLLSNGGTFAHLWWNGGRWNPGRAVHHLLEEGRITIVRNDVESIQVMNGRATGVETRNTEYPADVVVVCAGALRTPQLLIASHLMTHDQVTLRQHFALNFVVELLSPSVAPFDTAVFQNIETSEGFIFMVNAYERVSATDTSHALLSIAHMNPRTSMFDVRAMKAAARHLGNLAKDLSAYQVFGSVHVDEHGTSLDQLLSFDDSDISGWLLHNVTPLAHPTSSCCHLVDGDGRVKGVDRLWLADASVLRSSPTCTPAAPVTMEAIRIAQTIAGEMS
jgi:choline dehydrogenase-like flavoprotein